MNMEINYIERYLNTDEQVLFEAKPAYTEKVYYDFDMFNFKQRKKTMYILFMIVFIFAIVGGAIIMFADFGSGLVSVILGIAGLLYPRVMFKRLSARESKSIVKGGTYICRFYQDYFVEAGSYTLDAMPYGIVVDAHETDGYFYIFISDRSAYILPKNSFVLNTPQEMRKLLEIKLGNRFTVHC